MILVVLVGPPARCESSAEGQDSPKVQAHLEKGYKYLRREKYPQAIEAFKSARELSEAPCRRCLEGSALACYRAKRYEDAARAYEELFAAAPDALSILRRLVRLYDRVGTPEKSLAVYEDFLESSDEPGDMITVYNELGVRRLTPGSGLDVHRNASAAAFRSALNLATGRSNLLRRNLAEALWQLGAEEEALTVLDGMSADDEDSWASLLALERGSKLLEREQQIRSTWEVPARSAPTSSAPALSMEGFVANRVCTLGYDLSRFGQAIPVEGEVQRPEKMSAPQPQYSTAARQQRIQGTVTVRAIIDERGCVLATQVLSGLPYLNDPAVSAIRRWRFRPATLKGEPVVVYYDLTVNFRLQ